MRWAANTLSVQMNWKTQIVLYITAELIITERIIATMTFKKDSLPKVSHQNNVRTGFMSVLWINLRYGFALDVNVVILDIA